MNNYYVLPVEFIVRMKEGSGTALTVEDIAQALKNMGHTVTVAHNPIVKDKIHLVVEPPRHIVTGEDVSLELEEKTHENYWENSK